MFKVRIAGLQKKILDICSHGFVPGIQKHISEYSPSTASL